MTVLFNDVRGAARGLRKRLSSFVAAVLTLIFGIGAVAAIVAEHARRFSGATR